MVLCLGPQTGFKGAAGLLLFSQMIERDGSRPLPLQAVDTIFLYQLLAVVVGLVGELRVVCVSLPNPSCSGAYRIGEQQRRDSQ